MGNPWFGPIATSGYGWPFHNPDELEMEGWVNKNTEIFKGVRLQEFLKDRIFHLAYPETPEVVQKKWDGFALPGWKPCAERT